MHGVTQEYTHTHSDALPEKAHVDLLINHLNHIYAFNCTFTCCVCGFHTSAASSKDIFAVLPQSVDEWDIWEQPDGLGDIHTIVFVVESCTKMWQSQ